MKHRIIQLIKGATLLALLGIGIQSCKKDDTPVKTAVGVPTDYQQTAQTQFITADGVKYAYRILGTPKAL